MKNNIHIFITVPLAIIFVIIALAMLAPIYILSLLSGSRGDIYEVF